MTRKEFFSKFELLLRQEPGSMQGTESLDDLAGWDSLSVVEFTMFAESELGELVTPAAVEACRSVQDLLNLFPGKIE